MKIKNTNGHTNRYCCFVGDRFWIAVFTSGRSLKIVGDIFLRLMQMAIPVLILGQIIQAVGALPQRIDTVRWENNRGLRDFLLTCCGLGCRNGSFLYPGKGIDFSQTAADTVQAQEISPSETLINFIPTNIFDALSKGSIIQIIVLPCFWDCFKSFCKRIRSRNY